MAECVWISPRARFPPRIDGAGDAVGARAASSTESRVVGSSMPSGSSSITADELFSAARRSGRRSAANGPVGPAPRHRRSVPFPGPDRPLLSHFVAGEIGDVNGREIVRQYCDRLELTPHRPRR